MFATEVESEDDQEWEMFIHVKTRQANKLVEELTQLAVLADRRLTSIACVEGMVN